MLFLTRKVGEIINIGDNIEVLVSSIGGQHVKIGIKAPDDVSIDRAEVRQNKIDEPGYYDKKMADRDRNR
ncbi:MAG: carbon storage regulator [Gammaproteobacteria bacterium]